jgi:hypothetical protein
MKALTRIVVFLLASTSIACLLGEMYGLWPMRRSALVVFVPSCCVLIAMALYQWRGNGRTRRTILIGAAAGLAATAAYDAFRLPFVFATCWGLDGVLPPLPLFTVIPKFGAMILHGTDSGLLLVKLAGWLYHGSNGITFGVMYAAMIDGRWRKGWPVAILFAVGLELAMLLTPYPATFGIRVTTAFVIVTLAAHVIFGVTMGLASIDLEARMARC